MTVGKLNKTEKKEKHQDHFFAWHLFPLFFLYFFAWHLFLNKKAGVRRKGAAVYAAIPHSRCVMEAISNGEMPVRACEKLARQVEKIYKKLKNEKGGCIT